MVINGETICIDKKLYQFITNMVPPFPPFQTTHGQEGEHLDCIGAIPIARTITSCAKRKKRRKPYKSTPSLCFFYFLSTNRTQPPSVAPSSQNKRKGYPFLPNFLLLTYQPKLTSFLLSFVFDWKLSKLFENLLQTRSPPRIIKVTNPFTMTFDGFL